MARIGNRVNWSERKIWMVEKATQLLYNMENSIEHNR